MEKGQIKCKQSSKLLEVERAFAARSQNEILFLSLPNVKAVYRDSIRKIPFSFAKMQSRKLYNVEAFEHCI